MTPSDICKDEPPSIRLELKILCELFSNFYSKIVPGTSQEETVSYLLNYANQQFSIFSQTDPLFN